jgi:hypothetical protein
MSSNDVNVLDKLLIKMTKQVNNTNNEVGHQQADSCLVSLVKHLSEFSTEKEKILAIVDQYQKVRKWYA